MPRELRVQLVKENDVTIDFEPDILSNYSNSSGTMSYKSLHEPINRNQVARKQEPVIKYYKKRVMEEAIATGPELLQPLLLTCKEMEEIVLNQTKFIETLRIKKELLSQEYKNTAFTIIDQYFDQPAGQMLHLRCDTSCGQMQVQMIAADEVRRKNGGRLDEIAVRREMDTKIFIDEEAIRRNRIQALKGQKNLRSQVKCEK